MRGRPAFGDGSLEGATGFVKPAPVTVEVKACETKDVVLELKRAD